MFSERTFKSSDWIIVNYSKNEVYETNKEFCTWFPVESLKIEKVLEVDVKSNNLMETSTWMFENLSEIYNYLEKCSDFEAIFYCLTEKANKFWGTTQLRWQFCDDPECIEIVVDSDKLHYKENFDKMLKFEQETWEDRLTHSGKVLLSIECRQDG